MGSIDHYIQSEKAIGHGGARLGLSFLFLQPCFAILLKIFQIALARYMAAKLGLGVFEAGIGAMLSLTGREVPITIQTDKPVG